MTQTARETKTGIPPGTEGGQILFVCTGNTCRSPMAEVLTNHYLHEADLAPAWFATSAGTAVWKRMPAADGAVRAMREYGLDISQHRSRGVEEISLDDAVLILGMTQEHTGFLKALYPARQDIIYRFHDYLASGTGNEKLEILPVAGDIPDPFGLDLSVYLETASILDIYARALVRKLSAFRPGME